MCWLAIILTAQIIDISIIIDIPLMKHCLHDNDIVSV